MLVKLHKQNEKGQELYQNALTGAYGILASHCKKAVRSERSSRRTAQFKTPQVGAVNNNRKRTVGRKIFVFSTTTVKSKNKLGMEVLKEVPLTNSFFFKIEETEIRLSDGSLHTMKEHIRGVFKPTSKRIITVPQ